MGNRKDKMRNELRPAFMRNFSNHTIERYILIDDELMNDGQKDKFVKQINESLWHAIQETNILVEDRILPFVVVKRVVKDGDKIRIIINDFGSRRKLSKYEEAEKLNLDKVSHIINFKPLSPYRKIMKSDNDICGTAKLLIDESEQVAAAVDIFLDIAMFNSYSFLKDMPIEKKKAFNLEKMSFQKRTKGKCYYEIDKKSPPEYFSFAFNARESSNSIDYYKYVWIWRKFISEYSGSQVNFVDNPEKLLELHVDEDNLKDRVLNSEYWKSYPKGAYLLLRINKTPKTKERKNMIGEYFGAEKFHVGIIKVVPLNEYYKPFVQQQLRELYISAFKIVV